MEIILTSVKVLRAILSVLVNVDKNEVEDSIVELSGIATRQTIGLWLVTDERVGASFVR